jgi:predicted metal-dependent hydrolase
VTEIAYRIRRSPRARRVRVSVDAEEGVSVVLPRRAAQREADEAVDELRPWIERRLRALDRARAELGVREGFAPYLGEELELVPQPRRQRVARRDDRLLVPSGDHRPAL